METTMLLTLFIFSNVLVRSGNSVKINKLEVPEITKHNSPVVLDCDFSLEDKEQDLVVKWFFNHSQVYQWIPGTKTKPQGLSILKDRLNLEYKASKDANSAHRALYINRASPDLSGDYTCSVSTFQSEDIRTKRMLVLVSEKSLVLRRLRADEEGVMRVQCMADGVFPKPVMSLHSQEREISGVKVTAEQHGDLYAMSATATLPELKDPEEFSCRLHIPQANYTTRRETVFYPGTSAEVSISSTRWLIISSLYFLLLRAKL